MVLSIACNASTCVNSVYGMKGFAFNLWQSVLLEDGGRCEVPQAVGMLVDGWPLARILHSYLGIRCGRERHLTSVRRQFPPRLAPWSLSVKL